MSERRQGSAPAIDRPDDKLPQTQWQQGFLDGFPNDEVAEQKIDHEAINNPDLESPLDQDTESSLEDAQNRMVSQEILSQSAKVRLGVAENAQKAISAADKLQAQLKNFAGSPLKAVREFRKNRAEKSLERKQLRLNKKHDRQTAAHEAKKQHSQSQIDTKYEQTKAQIDGLSSSRLQKIRLEKLDAKHQKRQAKLDKRFTKKESSIEETRLDRQSEIDAFETGKVMKRRDKYAQSTNRAEARIGSVEQRSAESQQSIENNRRAAIHKKELAMGRKALREALRRDGASRKENLRVMEEIMGDTDGAVLRDLGRKFVKASDAESSLTATQRDRTNLERQRASNQNLLERARSVQKVLPEKLVANTTEQAELGESLSELRDKISEMARDGSDRDNPDYDAALEQQRQVGERLYELQRDQQRIERQIQELPDRIAQYHMQEQSHTAQLESLELAIDQQKTAAQTARGELYERSDAILNPDNSLTTNNQQENR